MAGAEKSRTRGGRNKAEGVSRRILGRTVHRRRGWRNEAASDMHHISSRSRTNAASTGAGCQWPTKVHRHHSVLQDGVSRRRHGRAVWGFDTTRSSIRAVYGHNVWDVRGRDALVRRTHIRRFMNCIIRMALGVWGVNSLVMLVRRPGCISIDGPWGFHIT